jgi:hypothetical protein
VKSDKHYKASGSTKGKAWRWPCDVVFTATSSEEGHNICKTAMPASVPAIGFGCSRSLCPCLRKSLCVDKLGIDIYHIDMTMFCFPWYPRKRTNFGSETSKCRTSARRCVASHVSRQPRSTSRHRVPQRGGGILGYRRSMAMTRSQNIVPLYTPSYTLLNLSLLERRYSCDVLARMQRGLDNDACSRWPS